MKEFCHEGHLRENNPYICLFLFIVLIYFKDQRLKINTCLTTITAERI